MAKHAALPWDCVLSAENIRRYKPDAEIYRLVPGVFDRRPDQVMLVAAHEHDSQAAQSHGLRTATSTARSNTGRENHPALRRMGDLTLSQLTFRSGGSTRRLIASRRCRSTIMAQPSSFASNSLVPLTSQSSKHMKTNARILKYGIACSKSFFVHFGLLPGVKNSGIRYFSRQGAKTLSWTLFFFLCALASLRDISELFTFSVSFAVNSSFGCDSRAKFNSW